MRFELLALGVPAQSHETRATVSLRPIPNFPIGWRQCESSSRTQAARGRHEILNEFETGDDVRTTGSAKVSSRISE